MKRAILLLILLQVVLVARAQEEGGFAFGAILEEEGEMKFCHIDSNANAVVLKEFGKAWIEYDASGFQIHFYFHQRIKIFNSKAFNQANIELLLQKGSAGEEYFDIKGSTFNGKKE